MKISHALGLVLFFFAFLTTYKIKRSSPHDFEDCYLLWCCRGQKLYCMSAPTNAATAAPTATPATPAATLLLTTTTS